MSWITNIAGAVGSVIGGIQSRNAAQNASQAEQKYSNEALQLEQQYQQQGLNFENGLWNQDVSNFNPYLQAGQNASLTLADLTNTPGQGLLASYPGGAFQAPTLAEAEATPGYQFQLQQGEQALQNSAAAKGELLDPNAAEAESQYAENLAQTDYSNVYNQAMQTYGTNFNAWNTQQQNEYNRLLGEAGLGEQATTNLGGLGNQLGNTETNLLLGGGQQQAQQLTNIGAEIGAGDIGSANAWNSMISGILASAPGNNGQSPYMGGGGGGFGGGGGSSFSFPGFGGGMSPYVNSMGQ